MQSNAQKIFARIFKFLGNIADAATATQGRELAAVCRSVDYVFSIKVRNGQTLGGSVEVTPRPLWDFILTESSIYVPGFSFAELPAARLTFLDKIPNKITGGKVLGEVNTATCFGRQGGARYEEAAQNCVLLGEKSYMDVALVPTANTPADFDGYILLSGIEVYRR